MTESGQRRAMDLADICSRIVTAADPEAALRDASLDICAAFGAERMTIYKAAGVDAWNPDLCFEKGYPAVADGSIHAILQTGLERFGRIRLMPSRNGSVAGYVALERRLVNISNVHDEAELSAFAPPITWLPAVDEKSGYRSAQMLCAPILGLGEPDSGERALLGVVQLINRHDGSRFPRDCEHLLGTLCEALMHAFSFTRGYTVEERRRQREATLAAPSEGAPANLAAERDSLLQHYRDRSEGAVRGTNRLDLRHFRTWSEEDVRDLEWICALAVTGHAGAWELERMVLRPWDPEAAAAVAGEEREMRAMLDGLAKRFPAVAFCLASFECITVGARASTLARWLELAGPSFADMAQLIRELYGSHDTFQADEAWCIRRAMESPPLPSNKASNAETLKMKLQDLQETRRDLGVEHLTERQMRVEDMLDLARRMLSRPDPPRDLRRALELVMATGEEAQKRDAAILLRSLDTRARKPKPGGSGR